MVRREKGGQGGNSRVKRRAVQSQKENHDYGILNLMNYFSKLAVKNNKLLRKTHLD